MSILSKRLFGSVAKDYRVAYGLEVSLANAEGHVVMPEALGPIMNLPSLCHLRWHNLSESVRWGEPQVFFAAPGIMSWIVPMVEHTELKGGLCGGYILLEDDAASINVAVNYLVGEGGKRKEALQFVQGLETFEQERVREAADNLYDLFYQYSGWNPLSLKRNRDQMQQQRQIAEEIHQRKVEQNRAYPYDDERILLSLIRVGDRAGARKMFNKMLAAMFLYSPKPVVVRARAIEMMGYLVRTAVEDSPLAEPLLERHMQWIERIVETNDFDDLCNVLSEALDDFMNSIFLQGVSPVSPAVSKALDYIAANYTEPIALEEIAAAAGLSTFRIAHLLKAATGKTALQNIHYLRIQEARRLLETSDMSCTDIAYETGFGDQSYFIKQFRKWMGITPAKYRKSCRT
ncbi:helix-turn-helix domain-containing protein [Pontiella sulfatireligans]|uniref:HTH-type transcriptional activator Btr n=1 Tax=Pontiella sulfatireligans TaxID=2750658 RepID=A0A6C2UVD8_9BACT|nr:helix-turn-helix domain-containing protein [Pontiella sulfatireligans]VGO23361.1 HTH-type transcriptional activator Btr [Pontiella sulfatireligans]